VIFSSLRQADEVSAAAAYAKMGDEMVALAAEQPGYLGVESARDSTGFGVTVSYWTSNEAAARWKKVARHSVAQQRGKDEWYAYYTTRVATVERCYSFSSM
jgi:heme-degrading monooxygenase HmoA